MIVIGRGAGQHCISALAKGALRSIERHKFSGTCLHSSDGELYYTIDNGVRLSALLARSVTVDYSFGGLTAIRHSMMAKPKTLYIALKAGANKVMPA
jgi:hypothetical protein